MRTPTPDEIEMFELEDELAAWQDALDETQESLDLITGPDYDPEQHPDAEYHNQDVEFLEREIGEAIDNIERITRKMQKLERKSES